MCGRLKLQGAVPGLGETVRSPDPAVRLASVQALSEVASPGALTAMELAIDDDDRAVRLAAVRAMGAKGIRNALKRIEPVILGKSDRDLDLTEKMAFFEAYGGIAGPTAIPTLQSMLLTPRPARATRRVPTRAPVPPWRWVASARPRRARCCRRSRMTRNSWCGRR